MARILVVDDDAHVRSAVRRTLSRGGHEVWDVADGAEALEQMETMEFDLLLTDVYMTGTDGMELMVRARRRGFCDRVREAVRTGQRCLMKVPSCSSA